MAAYGDSLLLTPRERGLLGISDVQVYRAVFVRDGMPRRTVKVLLPVAYVEDCETGESIPVVWTVHARLLRGEAR